MTENILIIGASSAIALAVARNFAKDQAQFVLAARNGRKLESVAQDLIARGASACHNLEIDFNNFDQHDSLWQFAKEKAGTIHRVLLCYGSLSNQTICEKDYQSAEREISTNFLSAVSLLTPIVNDMEADCSGQVAVVSSVAGDRGRQSNYYYGCAKAALSCYLSGLRSRLQKSDVAVLTIKPGFVATTMTDHLKKNFLFATPDRVGLDIYVAMLRKRNVIYTPGFWRLIMTVVKAIPEVIFKRLSI